MCQMKVLKERKVVVSRKRVEDRGQGTFTFLELRKY